MVESAGDDLTYDLREVSISSIVFITDSVIKVSLRLCWCFFASNVQR